MTLLHKLPLLCQEDNLKSQKWMEHWDQYLHMARNLLEVHGTSNTQEVNLDEKHFEVIYIDQCYNFE